MKKLWSKQNWVAKSGGVANFRSLRNFHFFKNFKIIYIYIYIYIYNIIKEKKKAKFLRLRNFCTLPSAPKIKQKPAKINTRKFFKKCRKMKINLKTNIN